MKRMHQITRNSLVIIAAALVLTPPFYAFAEYGTPYFIVADHDSAKINLSQSVRVYNPDVGYWLSLNNGLVTRGLSDGTAYVDGVPNQSLQPNRIYYAFAFIPTGQGHLGINGVQLDLIDKWFTSGDPSGRYSVGDNGPYIIDSKGNTGALVGMVSTYQGKSVWSYFSRDEAVMKGATPGNYTSSSPWSLRFQQPLAVYTDTPIRGTVAAPYGIELDPKLRTIVTSWERKRQNARSDRYYLNGYVQLDTVGATAMINIAATPLWGSGQAQYLASTRVTATSAGQILPIYLAAQVPPSDGAYLFSVSASLDKGAMTYTFQPVVQTLI